MKHLLAWVAWWFALFWLWLVLVGQWNREQLIAAAIAAAIAATLAEFARVRTGFKARIPARALRDVPQVLLMVFVDFGIVSWALLRNIVRREVVRGQFVSRELSRSRDARGVGPQAWTTLAASYSPNAYVLDIDPETRRVLLHDLVSNRHSESPA